MPKTYSTGEAAKKIGISRQTLQSWIDKNSVATPELQEVGRVLVRLWTDADIQRAREFRGTLRPGRRAKRRK